MNETSNGNGLLASLRAEGGRGVVRVEDTFATDMDDLWSAVTEPGRLARWIAEVDGDLRLGGEFRALFTSGWEGIGRVDVCDAPRRLLVTTSSGPDDETVIEATITEDGTGTRLVIEERGLSLEEYAGHGSGWQAHIEDLAAHLAGRERGDWADRWKVLTPAYERLASESD